VSNNRAKYVKIFKKMKYLFALIVLVLVYVRVNTAPYNVYDVELKLLSDAVTQLSNQPKTDEYIATYFKTSEGSVKVYNPKIFQSLRTKFHTENQLYCSSLSPNNLVCVINSDSKSGQRFWISNDGQIVLKTLKHYEVKNLKSIINMYENHVMMNEYSTIAGILGVYRVKLKRNLFSKYYLVTKNVFPLLQGKDTYIHNKYDLKGSTQGRLASSKSSVQKDVDLMRSGQLLHLGETKELLLKSLDKDLMFLRYNSFMDYSLLVSVENSPSKNHRRFPLFRRYPKFGSNLPEDRFVHESIRL
jgi:hypothetical protein